MKSFKYGFVTLHVVETHKEIMLLKKVFENSEPTEKFFMSTKGFTSLATRYLKHQGYKLKKGEKKCKK
jgi:hypothetical protein